MNCWKWALTLAELDASDLIRLVSHSLQASSWRTGLPDTLSKREKAQRAAAWNGLRIISQNMRHVCYMLYGCVFLHLCGWAFWDCALVCSPFTFLGWHIPMFLAHPSVNQDNAMSSHSQKYQRIRALSDLWSRSGWMGRLKHRTLTQDAAELCVSKTKSQNVLMCVCASCIHVTV